MDLDIQLVKQKTSIIDAYLYLLEREILIYRQKIIEMHKCIKKIEEDKQERDIINKGLVEYHNILLDCFASKFRSQSPHYRSMLDLINDQLFDYYQ